jgi:hypothetical protein
MGTLLRRVEDIKCNLSKMMGKGELSYTKVIKFDHFVGSGHAHSSDTGGRKEVLVVVLFRV